MVGHTGGEIAQLFFCGSFAAVRPRVFLRNGGLGERGLVVFQRFCFSLVISPLGRREAINLDR
jgi:hypothetical protein